MAIMFHHVPVECINTAAVFYAIPAPLIMSIIHLEGGHNGLAQPNKNGTFDYGVMQINTIWLPQIKQNFGYSGEDLKWDPCKNIYAGSWVLSQSMSHSNNLLSAVGNYHSHTPSLNHAYAIQVLNVYYEINDYLAPVTSTRCKKQGRVC